MAGGLLALGLVQAGCATSPSPGMPPPVAGAGCDDVLGAWDAEVTAAGVGDAQWAPVPGHPGLRVERFLASHPARHGDGEAFEAWVGALRTLDARARRIEWRNLHESGRDALGESMAGSPPERAEACAEERVRAVLASREAREDLVRVARVPDSYLPGARVLGLYPLTSVPFLAGVERLHGEFAAQFARPLDDLPVAGVLQRYRPPGAGPRASPEEVAEILRRSAGNPLGVPQPRGEDLERLLATFAPVLEVDVVSDDDRIGRPGWAGATRPVVDVAEPVVYRQVSHAWFDGRALLQLSYVAWFPARPRTQGMDLLGGHLDGITWRVTLGPGGRPLLFDAMHNCGCYHVFLPTSRLAAAPPAKRYEEPALVLPSVADGPGRIVLRVAHRTHYLQRAYRDTAGRGGTQYALAGYRALRVLPLPGGGSRSLFGPDALVSGTERGERWLFWPMGVASAGAMRQWGHHATAFVGRRHFDDPDLVERYFVAPSSTY